MKPLTQKNNTLPAGYSLIELVTVVVLMTALSALSIQAIMMATDTYVTTTRDYLEVFRESTVAMEKMVREIRETDPGSITIATGEISFTKHTDHYTPEDSSLEITFRKSGSFLRRDSGTLADAQFLEDVTAFTPSQDGNGVVILELSTAKGESDINLRTAVFPRQPQ